MPLYRKDSFATPFGKNEFLRSTQDIKTISRTVAASTIPAETIDGHTGQKVLQPGTVMAVITVGPDVGKIGPFQGAGTNEVQVVTISGSPTGGTFTLTFQGETTAALAYNATAAQVKAALVAASTDLGTDDITVTGSAGGPYTVTFVGSQEGGQDQPAMTASGSFTGGTTPSIAVSTSTSGAAGATDGRENTANIVGICQTFLPWQLMEGDREVSVIYEADVVQANCFELNAAGARIALTDTTAGQMYGKKTLDIRFAV